MVSEVYVKFGCFVACKSLPVKIYAGVVGPFVEVVSGKLSDYLTVE